MSALPLPSPPNKRQKDAEFFAGTDKLFAERKSGQTYSCREIAAACGLSRRTIEFLEAKALQKMARRLQQECPELVAQALADVGGDMGSFLARLTKESRYLGKTHNERKKARRFDFLTDHDKERVGKAAPGEMTQDEFIRAVRLRNPEEKRGNFMEQRDRNLARARQRGKAA